MFQSYTWIIIRLA